MKIKKFYLNIDEDSVLFFQLPLDNNDQVEEKMQKKDYALSNNPTIIDITHLNYTPNKDSVWNGVNFVSENSEVRPACKESCLNGCATFAFVIDNVYHGMNGYCVNAENEGIIAAFQSNPTITYLIEEV